MFGGVEKKSQKKEKRTKRDMEQNEVRRDGEAMIERVLWAKWERCRSSCDRKTAGGRRHQARQTAADAAAPNVALMAPHTRV